LSGRDGFGAFFGSETPIFHCAGGKETETKGSHWGDRTLVRTRDRMLDRTRSRVQLVLPTSRGSARTGASSRSRDRHVRSSPRETVKHATLIGHGGASGHDRPNASGREWVLTGLKPDARCNASGQLLQCVRLMLRGRRHCMIGASGQLSSMSDRLVTVGALSRSLRSGIRR
jgi:hypothetical protein